MAGQLCNLKAFRKARNEGKDIEHARQVCTISGKALFARVRANALRQTALPDHIPRDKILVRVTDCPPRFQIMEERKNGADQNNMKDLSQTQEIEVPEQIDAFQSNIGIAVSNNPHVWELMKFLVHKLSMSETEILYDSIAPYFKNINVNEKTIRILYNILEDGQKTKQLIKQESEFWASLTPAEEKPWRHLHERYWTSKSRETRQDKKIYDPLYTPAYNFSNDLIESLLLLRFLFRQHFPKKKRFLKRKQN